MNDLPRTAAAAASKDDATRLTAGDVAALHKLLRGRVGNPGVRALAAELGTTEYTVYRALRRAIMRPATVARLRAKLSARADEPSAVVLTRDERTAISRLIRSAGDAAIARLFNLAPSTLLRAATGGRARRATIARIRDGLESALRARTNADARQVMP